VPCPGPINGLMKDDWSERIRGYRSRSGLTQEALADLFNVEPRTIRRWEAGASRPPLDIRQRLMRTRVPLIERADTSTLLRLVEMSTEGIMLLDDDLTILAMSPRERAWFMRQYGRDGINTSWEPHMPSFFHALLEEHGGWRALLQGGLSSLTSDFRMPRGDTGNAADHVGRAQYTILRLADGTRIHTSLSSTLPPDSPLQPPKLTFLDEIMAEE
jgi:transcriptional regulator with XRE-family HTH domain